MSSGKEKLKLDNVWLGAITGIVAPIITFIIFINSVYPAGYLEHIRENNLVFFMVPKVMSLSAIPNLAFFLFSVYTNRYKSGKGVLGATIALALAVFILKLSA